MINTTLFNNTKQRLYAAYFYPAATALAGEAGNALGTVNMNIVIDTNPCKTTLLGIDNFGELKQAAERKSLLTRNLVAYSVISSGKAATTL